MIAATIYTQRRLSSRGAEGGVVLDIVLWAIPFGIIGARFYHVLTHGEDYFYPGANLWDVIAIWDGGNALYGSLIAAPRARDIRLPNRTRAQAHSRPTAEAGPAVRPADSVAGESDRSTAP